MRFTKMHKAFQHFDLDNNGRLSRSEMGRMLRFAGCIRSLDELLSHCDTNEDGVLDYGEFVDAFAHDTVQRDTFFGNDHLPKVITPEDVNPAAGIFGLKASPRFGEPMRPINCAQGLSHRHSGFEGPLLGPVRERLEQRYAGRFAGPLHAFKQIDTDGNGTISRREMAHAIARWNLPGDASHVDSLMMATCEDAGDGLSYNAFRRGLFA